MPTTSGELFLQQVLDVLGTQGERHQVVAERLNGEGLAIGHIAIALLRALRNQKARTANTASIHERKHRPARIRRSRGLKLSVGDQVAGQHVAGCIRSTTGQIHCNRTNHLIGQAPSQLPVGLNDAADLRIGCRMRVTSDDQPIGDTHPSDVGRARIERQIDVAEHPAEGTGTGHRNQPAASVRQAAVVSGMGMPTDYQVDRRIQLRDDVRNRRSGELAIASIDIPNRAALGAAFMNQHHDCLDPLAANLCHPLVDRLGFIDKFKASDRAWRHDRWCCLQGQPDEGDPHAIE